MSELKMLYEEKVTGPMDLGNITTWFLGKLHFTLSVEDYAKIVVRIQSYWMSDRDFPNAQQKGAGGKSHFGVCSQEHSPSGTSNSLSLYLGIHPFSPKLVRI